MTDDKWVNGVAFSVNRTSAQTINTGADRKINFDTKTVDIGNNYNTTTNRFEAPVKGVYRFYGSVAWGTTASLTRVQSTLFVNGTKVAILGDSNVTGVAGSAGGDFTTELNANDYVEIYGQPVGANVAIASNTGTRFEGSLITRT